MKLDAIRRTVGHQVRHTIGSIAALGALGALSASALLPLPAAAQQASADFKERTVRVSHVVPKDHPFQIGIDKFAELLAQRAAAA